MISFKNSTLPLKFNHFFSMKNQIHNIIIQEVLNLFVYRYIELILGGVPFTFKVQSFTTL